MAYGAQFSFGVFSLYAFSYGTLAFVSGGLTDRWGPRIVIAAGGIFLGAGWIAMSFTRSLWQPYAFYGVIAFLFMSTASTEFYALVLRGLLPARGRDAPS